MDSDSDSTDSNIEIIPVEHLENLSNGSEDNLSDFDNENEILILDPTYLDFKVNQVNVVNNIKWINFQCRQPLCVTQNYYSVSDEKLCNSCFYETFRRITENLNPTHHSEHFSGTMNSIKDYIYECSSCKRQLFTYCLVIYCTTCNY